MRTTDTQIVFEYSKSLNKSCSVPKLPVFKSKTGINVNDKVNILNGLFQCFFSSKISFGDKEIEPENPEFTTFNVSKNSLLNILLTLDPKQARGTDGLPTVFYHKTCNEIFNCLN